MHKLNRAKLLLGAPLLALLLTGAQAAQAGVLDKVEIWSKEAWEARTADVEENIEDIASDMEDLGLSI